MTQALHALKESLNTIIVGKSDVIDMALTGLLSGGHLLLEDHPGTGKTLLSLAMAQLTGLDFKRIQCTNDLMPSDVLGTQVLDAGGQTFRLHQGPIFAQLVLADEINRASPKTQSALLEAMAEGQVSIDGETCALPQPFFLIATQNPDNHQGTFALPEAQLDRFTLRLSLGYPAAEEEVQILAGGDKRQQLSELNAVMSAADVLQLQQEVRTMRPGDALCDYVQRLLQASREHPQCQQGLSTRAGQALLLAASAYSRVCGDELILPAHVQAVFVAVAAHRLLSHSHSGQELATQLLDQVAV